MPSRKPPFLMRLMRSKATLKHVAHVVVHIHLLQRGSPETAGIVGPEGHPWKFIDHGEALGERTPLGSREIVVSYTAHHVQTLGDVPVKLRIAVDVVLCVIGVFYELVGCEIVVYVVGPHEKRVLPKRIAEQPMHHMLPVAVVVVVGACAVGHEIGLVILVESVGQLQMAVMVPCIFPLQYGAVSIEMVVVRVALA